jgi:hypothetical protein
MTLGAFDAPRNLSKNKFVFISFWLCDSLCALIRSSLVCPLLAVFVCAFAVSFALLTLSAALLLSAVSAADLTLGYPTMVSSQHADTLDHTTKKSKERKIIFLSLSLLTPSPSPH